MFELSQEQKKKLEEWKKNLKPPEGSYSGAIGGRFTYLFTPTSLGVVIVVQDSMSKTEIDLSEYDMW